MEIKAQLNHLRIAPRKVRLAINLLKGKQIREVESILSHLSKRSAEPLLKLFRSAVANAKHNFNTAEDLLSVKSISVNQGFVLKRFRPRAFGRAAPLRKKTSHVSLVLDVKEEGVRRETSLRGMERQRGPTVREVDLADIKNSAAGLRRKELTGDQKEIKIKNKPVDFVRRMFRRKAI